MSDESRGSFMLPVDSLAGVAPAEVQRQAARMAQDAFTQLFRLTLERDAPALQGAVADIARLSRNWAQAGVDDEARALRLALLVSGIDQWGLAWCQAFRLSAIPGASELLGRLRTGLDAGADARFARAFAAIDAAEGDAIDFKMDLRRNIHLGLWHAMIACEDRAEAETLLAALGGMMVALTQKMPLLGWRLVADALAHIQLRCLTEAAASTELAREVNAALFTALRQNLPRELSEPMFAHANQVVLAWQQARRAGMN
ncbi:MAG: hypothetical protein HZA62_14020 [Rhodocyclales bacterium]|nr:hypothetical protein [Rhodocyclales bacterium]